jgi:hypothetical protein
VVGQMLVQMEGIEGNLSPGRRLKSGRGPLVWPGHRKIDEALETAATRQPSLDCGGCLLSRRRAVRGARQRFPELAHIDVDDRCGEERKQLRRQQTADDRRLVTRRGRQTR